MSQYIDKDALVAEIKELREHEIRWMERQGFTHYRMGERDAYTRILKLLDTLEVKEENSNDAFIEKIENYLNSKLYDWISVSNPDQRSCPYVIPKKDFIEDFKNYLKYDKV